MAYATEQPLRAPASWDIEADYDDDVGSSISSRFTPRRAVYHIAYEKHATTLARKLHSVSGLLLVDEENNPVHVWDSRLKDLLDKGLVRHHHIPGHPGGFGFFTTSHAEYKEFSRDLKRGRCHRPRTYHIYIDQKDAAVPHDAVVSWKK